MNFWNEADIETVYRRLRMLAVLFAFPGVVSTYELIVLGNSKIFIPFVMGGALPLLIVAVSPLELSINMTTNIPLVAEFTLFLTAVFMVSLAGALVSIWYQSIVRSVMYIPGYKTFGDVKGGIASLIRGKVEGRKMLALFIVITIATYVGFTLFFVTRIAKLFLDSPLELVAALCFFIVAVAYIPVYRFLEQGLKPAKK
ncbi:MAG: hypothetical protein QXR19_08820 [Candidatus Jordarchaeaceae archaeon]